MVASCDDPLLGGGAASGTDLPTGRAGQTDRQITV